MSMDARDPMILSGGGCCPAPPMVLPEHDRVDRTFVHRLEGGQDRLLSLPMVANFCLQLKIRR